MTSTEPKSVTIPEFPPLPGDRPKPLARRLWNALRDEVVAAREAAKVVYAYRVSEANEAELLRTSDAPEAKEYQAAKRQTDQAIAEIKAECDRLCQPFIEDRDRQIKERNDALSAHAKRTREALSADNGVTAEDMVAALDEYKASADYVKDTLPKLNKQLAQPIVYSMPGLDGKKGSQGERGFTPRFSSIVINDSQVTDDEGKPILKLADFAEWLGTQTGTTVTRDRVRDTMLAQSLNNDRAIWDALEAESPVSFVFDYSNADKPENNRRYHITVTKAPPAARKNKKDSDSASSDTGDNEAPDDDDDDDDDDESSE